MVMVFYATDLVALMTTCRACRGTRMYMFMPLGDHPPANSFVRPGREQDEVLARQSVLRLQPGRHALGERAAERDDVAGDEDHL